MCPYRKQLKRLAKEVLPKDKRELFVEFFFYRFCQGNEESSFDIRYAREWAGRFQSKCLFQSCDRLSWSILMELGYKFVWTMSNDNISESLADDLDFYGLSRSSTIYLKEDDVWATDCEDYYTYKTFQGFPATDEQEKKYNQLKKAKKLMDM